MSGRLREIEDKAINRIPMRVITTTLVVILAYALTTVLVQPFSYSLGAMSSMASADFKITDMYQQIADSRSVHTLSSDIVIVDLGNADRDKIAETIELINLCDPKVIGLDVCFPEAREGDEPLLQAISLSDRLVAVKMLKKLDAGSDRNEQFVTSTHSYFEGMTGPGVVYAASNYPSAAAGGTIRRFRREFAIANGDTVPSFALAVARMADPEKARALEARKHYMEPIYYPSTEFAVYTPDELMDHADDLIGKIVIVGTMHDPADLHRTPLDPRMPGTLIQAHAVNTVLTGNYLSACPGWIEQLVAMAIAFIFVYISMNVKSGIRGMLLRFLQVCTLYFVLYAGYWFFIERNVVIDFSRSFLMMTFAFFAVDVWNGLVTLYQLIVRKLRERRAKRTRAEVNDANEDTVDEGSLELE